MVPLQKETSSDLKRVDPGAGVASADLLPLKPWCDVGYSMQEYVISVKHISQYRYDTCPSILSKLKTDVIENHGDSTPHLVLSPDFQQMLKVNAPLMPHLPVISRWRLLAAAPAFVADVCPTSSEAVANLGILLILHEDWIDWSSMNHAQILVRPDIELEPHFENYWVDSKNAISPLYVWLETFWISRKPAPAADFTSNPEISINL